MAERIECGEHERGEADVISWGRVGGANEQVRIFRGY